MNCENMKKTEYNAISLPYYYLHNKLPQNIDINLRVRIIGKFNVILED